MCDGRPLPRERRHDGIARKVVAVEGIGEKIAPDRYLVADPQEEEIMLGGDGEVKTYKINFSSQAAGPRVFTFRVEPFPDELVDRILAAITPGLGVRHPGAERDLILKVSVCSGAVETRWLDDRAAAT